MTTDQLQSIADRVMRRIAVKYGSTTRRDFAVVEFVLSEMVGSVSDSEGEASPPNAQERSAIDDPRGQWHPIETAPKDGTLILVYDGSLRSDRVTPAVWDRDEQIEGGECWRDRVFDWDRLNPTHWMPLPDPPVQQGPPEKEK